MRFLITGSNRGIGAALVGAVHEGGHQAITATRPGKGGDLQFDVTDREAIQRAARSLDGPIDILVNNAGVIGPERQSTLDMDFGGFADTLAINTLGPLAVAQAFLPHLEQSQVPKILTLSSQMAWMGYAKSDRIAYRASKVAVNKVMQGLATDLAPKGVAVVLVDPGWVRTEMGGDGADLEPAAVAAGILTLATCVSVADTGKFFLWSGEERSF